MVRTEIIPVCSCNVRTVQNNEGCGRHTGYLNVEWRQVVVTVTTVTTLL